MLTESERETLARIQKKIDDAKLHGAIPQLSHEEERFLDAVALKKHRLAVRNKALSGKELSAREEKILSGDGEPSEDLPSSARQSLLSVNQLSQLTGKDRRTVTARVADLPSKHGPKGALLYNSVQALESIYYSHNGKAALDQARTELALAQKRLADTKDEELRRVRIPIDVVIAANDQALQSIAATLKAARNKILTIELINELFEKLRAIPGQLKW